VPRLHSSLILWIIQRLKCLFMAAYVKRFEHCMRGNFLTLICALQATKKKSKSSFASQCPGPQPIGQSATLITYKRHLAPRSDPDSESDPPIFRPTNKNTPTNSARMRMVSLLSTRPENTPNTQISHKVASFVARSRFICHISRQNKI